MESKAKPSDVLLAPVTSTGGALKGRRARNSASPDNSKIITVVGIMIMALV